MLPSAAADDKPEFCIFPYSCPTAGRINPPVGQCGSETKTLLIGARLERIEEFIFYDSGIEVVNHKSVEKIPHDIHGDLRPTPAGTAVELTLRIANDCRLGEHFFRLRTHENLSEMLSFWVSPFPCVKESHWAHDRTANGGNGSMALAQPVKRGVTVLGYHPAYSTIDHDFYSVELEKGARLTVEVWSACLGFDFHGGITDCAITVYGPDKKKLAYCDDTSLSDMDPILSFTAPVKGVYYVNIHQSMDFEGALRPYAAHFSDVRRPMITYPLGGQAGSDLALTFDRS